MKVNEVLILIQESQYYDNKISYACEKWAISFGWYTAVISDLCQPYISLG